MQATFKTIEEAKEYAAFNSSKPYFDNIYVKIIQTQTINILGKKENIFWVESGCLSDIRKCDKLVYVYLNGKIIKRKTLLK